MLYSVVAKYDKVLEEKKIPFLAGIFILAKNLDFLTEYSFFRLFFNKMAKLGKKNIHWRNKKTQ